LFPKDPNAPGSVLPSVAEHDIETGDARPVSQVPRRVTMTQRKIIKEHIEALLKAGMIKPSKSPWASPILLVPKGENTWRMCIDYRMLNAVTKREIYAIPRIDDMIDSLGGSSYFSTLDLASGYFQIPVKESAKDKTAFISWEGQFAYNFMSFGLVNAPSTFQRTMDTVLAGLKWNSCQVYLDDIIIYSPTFEKHLIDVIAVLTRLRESGFKIKSSKCHFAVAEVVWLGHLLSKEGIRANPEKIELITNWEIPTTALRIDLHSSEN